MILCKGTKLFRYCLGDAVPKKWDTSFKSPEYNSGTYGPKNQIGAFFFYLNYDTADNVSNAAIIRERGKGNNYSSVTKTKCELLDDVNLLDITNCLRPVNILNVLIDNHIDCLTNDFSKIEQGKSLSFSILASEYEYIKNGNTEGCNLCRVINAGGTIDKFFHDHIGYTGQLLTDFGNGKAFKRQLVEHDFEGYIFDEEQDSPTVCLFDEKKLSPPRNEIEKIII